jgi:C4-dicarboxylate-specific signal transduction histidine kinase
MRKAATEVPWRDRTLALQLCLVACFLLVVHVTFIGVAARVERADIAEGLVQLEAEARGFEGWLRRSFDGIALSLDLLQERQRLLDLGNPGSAAVESILSGFVNSRRFDIVLVLKIDADGFGRWSNLPGSSVVDLRDRPHFQVHLAGHPGTYVADPVMGRLSRQLAVIFSRRLSHLDGSLAGVGVVSLDPVGAARQLVPLAPPATTRVLVWREGGEVVLSNLWASNPPTAPERPDPALAAALDGQESATLRRNDPGGRGDVLVALLRLPELGLAISLERSTAEMITPAAELRVLAWAIEGGLALLLLAGVAVVRWRQKALTALAAGAGREAEAAAVQREITRTLDSVPGVIYRGRLFKDGTYRLLYLSPSFTSVTGWPVAPLLKDGRGIMTLGDAIPSLEERRALMAELLATGSSVGEARIRRADGQMRWMRFARQLSAKDAHGIEIVGLMTDIEAERAAMASTIATSRLTTLGEMATGMAHELSQPLTAMSIAAENAISAIRKDRTDAAVERLERLPQLAQRARTIIDHLRLFGRQQPALAEAVRLDEVVAETLLLVGGTLRDANITLTIDVPDNLPPAHAGKVMLEQVLMNLLLNARDAMEAVPPTSRRIRISAAAAGGHLELAVSDTGPGIPDTVLPRLFEPFFTTKPPGEGTGLGLSICHGILQSFGGQITARNTAEGACFSMTLPHEAAAA